jgi:cysteine desulfurase / selenocysteine lyase
MGAHFNNAGSGLMTEATLAAVGAQLEREARLGQMEAEAGFDGAGLYAAAARLLNAFPHEIAIMESHTRGFSAALGRVSLEPGDRSCRTGTTPDPTGSREKPWPSSSPSSMP